MTHPQLSDATLHALLAGAVVAAKKAGAVMMECVAKRRSGSIALGASQVETKSCNVDFVTEYDKRCDELIIATLTEVSAAAGLAGASEAKLLTEETLPDVAVGDEPTWVVDPIDGTTSFMHGSFDCCVSIGLTVNKRPVVGVVWCPLLNELFTAVRGRGAFFNGEPIPVQRPRVARFEDAIVGFHLPARRNPVTVETSLAIVRELLVERNCHAVRCYGSAALDMCGVAIGRLDCYFELGINAWDICAGLIIAEESGCFCGGINDGVVETVRCGKMGVVCAVTAVLGRAAQELSLRQGLTPERYLA